MPADAAPNDPSALRDPPGLPSQVVLVHGGWHGGWVWERLAPRLVAMGHRVHAPTLTGLGDRLAEFTPELGLQTHVADIQRVVDALEPGPLTLIGHSYGGRIITAIADAASERVAALVYLDAVIPADGVADWPGFTPERQARMLAGAQGLGGHQVPPPDPSIWGIAPGSPEHRQLQDRLTPQPLKPMMEAQRITGRWRQVAARCYLLAAGPPASRFEHLHANFALEPGWSTAIVTGGHEMMWTHPEDLARALAPCIARDPGLPQRR